MTPEELEIFEKKLYDALIVWKTTNEFTDNLSELFQELIELTFNKRIGMFPNDEIRDDCKIAALLACYEGAKRFNPDKINPRTGEKTNPRIYFSIVIRSSLAGTWVKEANHKKTFQNESKNIKIQRHQRICSYRKLWW